MLVASVLSKRGSDSRSAVRCLCAAMIGLSLAFQGGCSKKGKAAQTACEHWLAGAGRLKAPESERSLAGLVARLEGDMKLVRPGTRSLLYAKVARQHFWEGSYGDALRMEMKAREIDGFDYLNAHARLAYVAALAEDEDVIASLANASDADGWGHFLALTTAMARKDYRKVTELGPPPQEMGGENSSDEGILRAWSGLVRARARAQSGDHTGAWSILEGEVIPNMQAIGGEKDDLVLMCLFCARTADSVGRKEDAISFARTVHTYMSRYQFKSWEGSRQEMQRMLERLGE